jgi:t-SNARE complex subunit (syntaxin)
MDNREGGNNISQKCALMFKYYTIRNTRNRKVVVVGLLLLLLIIIIIIIIQQCGS